MSKHTLICDDALKYLAKCDRVDTIFSDPPDNVGLAYNSYKDNLPVAEYLGFLAAFTERALRKCKTLWVSFNAQWLPDYSVIVAGLREGYEFDLRPCVQIFTFGQQTHRDLKPCYRPLWRFMRPGAELFPEAIRVESWRLRNGDKRAAPNGCVPSDVFDFPRVPGNSKQRRAWHKTQLHEGLVERAVRLTTPPGGSVLDPFGGTGTTLRVCRATDFSCTLVELDEKYCQLIAADNDLEEVRPGVWRG